MVWIKHLLSLISSYIKLVSQISIAEIIQIQYTIDSHLVIALFSLVELHLFPFFTGRRITPSRTVNQQIFGQSFNRYDLLFIFYIEGIEIPPKILLFKSLTQINSTSFIPLKIVLNYELPRSHYKKYFITFLSIYFQTYWSSSSSLVRSVRLVRTQTPKYFVPASTREFGSSSRFYNQTSKAIFIVEKSRLRKQSMPYVGQGYQISSEQQQIHADIHSKGQTTPSPLSISLNILASSQMINPSGFFYIQREVLACRHT